MNKKILQKVLNELRKEQPNLGYIEGVLETLMEQLPGEVSWNPEKDSLVVTNKPIEALPRDEEVKARVEAVKRLAKYE